MKKGQYITFDLDFWTNNVHKIMEVKSKIVDLCHDPMKIHESKCGVEVDGEDYGIPFSEVKSVSPADNEQLTFNL